jgi:D-tyrosyl-tRNA(Tyr) deacylase
MIALIQRVSSSRVSVANQEIAKINRGYNILLGILKDDTFDDIQKLVPKILKLRLFSDECGKMNLSIKDIDGEILVVSQFTLAANYKKGNRPSFTNAMNPTDAKMLYKEFIKELKDYIEVKEGIFGASMSVEIINDGPVTIILDSKKL